MFDSLFSVLIPTTTCAFRLVNHSSSFHITEMEDNSIGTGTTSTRPHTSNNYHTPLSNTAVYQGPQIPQAYIIPAAGVLTEGPQLPPDYNGGYYQDTPLSFSMDGTSYDMYDKSSEERPLVFTGTYRIARFSIHS